MNDRVITIKDIAKKANVSISTVPGSSMGFDRVGPETKEKVEKAIEDMNFVPNSIANSMITKRSQMIAVVVPELTNEFYIDVILGFDDHRFARFVKPAITVVDRPTVDMGICAATRLF